MPPPLPLLLLLPLPLLLQCGAAEPSASGRWQPPANGTEWLAALEAADADRPWRCDGGGSCQLELLRRERLEVVKQQVLSQLGLQAAPAPGRRRRLAAQFLGRVIDDRQLVGLRNRRALHGPADGAQPQAVWMLARQCE
ncbi:hypothetical protein FJT64_023268 [Amphibalanus amphitrite]|uniref:Uncharacterized protein n=1 Tax=Amphibalanus amphitrite TaxID=1232801 RepID=A0A6A4WIE5_AMPAM|nr:hypothetical protein FJT64_023268 [Amphibalanus amphitrite]